MDLHYGDKYDDVSYNDILIPACKEAGIAAFTGDGMKPLTMEAATQAIAENDGIGIPTIKPWGKETFLEKSALVQKSHAFAVAMDVDASGLPFLKGIVPPAGRKTEAELKEIISLADVPFIVKGIMTVKGAIKARNAGAAAIVVSNHGGRVLDGVPASATVLPEIVEAVGKDQCPATAEVLEEIVKAVDGSMKIFVDGGIRSGTDIFKALALGADAVLIARPFVNRIYGAQEEGVQVYVDRLQSELKDTMEMCGAKDLASITSDMIRQSTD